LVANQVVVVGKCVRPICDQYSSLLASPISTVLTVSALTIHGRRHRRSSWYPRCPRLSVSVAVSTVSAVTIHGRFLPRAPPERPEFLLPSRIPEKPHSLAHRHNLRRRDFGQDGDVSMVQFKSSQLSSSRKRRSKSHRLLENGRDAKTNEN
jgi:hypothetical protein